MGEVYLEHYSAQELFVLRMWMDTQLYVLAAQYPAKDSPEHYHLEQMRSYRSKVVEAQVRKAQALAALENDRDAENGGV